MRKAVKPINKSPNKPTNNKDQKNNNTGSETIITND